jgi:hypothetical protein
VTSECPPGPRATRESLRRCVRHRGWNPQFHLRPCIRFAPDLELPSELPRSFAHADEAEVPGASALLERGCADSPAIVADSDVQSRFSVRHLYLDILGARVLKRIAECFASDEESLLAHDRVQDPGSPLGTRPKLGRVKSSKLLALRGKSLREIHNSAADRA